MLKKPNHIYNRTTLTPSPLTAHTTPRKTVTLSISENTLTLYFHYSARRRGRVAAAAGSLDEGHRGDHGGVRAVQRLCAHDSP